MVVALSDRREATLGLCAGECGSRCCRAPFTVHLTPVELQRFKRAAAGRGHPRVRAVGAGRWFEVRFAETGGACPLLEGDGSCGVYDDRPEACRLFPQRPNPHCLVWTGTTVDLTAVVHGG